MRITKLMFGAHEPRIYKGARWGNLGSTPYNNRFNTDSAWPSRPLLGWVYGIGLTAKVAPEPPFACPFQARRRGATASRVNRALYGQFEEY
jgi:hypothetical protein